MREHLTRLHATAVSAFEREATAAGGEPPDVARVRERDLGPDARPALSTTARRTRNRASSTCRTCPPCRSSPRERLPWAAAIEARTAEVRDEYLAAVAAGAAHAPYVDAATRGPIWQELRGKLDWSSLHLYKVGEETPFARLFPKTLAALEAADIVRLDGRPVELLFSRLQPGAHIPPHFGTENQRITVHLPLIVPGDCEIRVGSARHAWREGELFAFDDSFEHEAWNRAGKDRVVLIFQAHNPDLRPEERAAIEYAIGAARALAQGAAGAVHEPWP